MLETKTILKIFLLLLLAGAIVIASSLPFFRRKWEQWHHPSEQSTLSRGRLAAVLCVIGIVLGGSVFDLVTMTEHWPFSYYPMFVGVQEPVITDRKFMKEVEGKLKALDPKYFSPISPYSLSAMVTSAKGNPVRMNEVCRGLVELLQTNGLRDVRGLGLYELTWTLDPAIANLDSPDHIDLLQTITDDDSN